MTKVNLHLGARDRDEPQYQVIDSCGLFHYAMFDFELHLSKTPQQRTVETLEVIAICMAELQYRGSRALCLFGISDSPNQRVWTPPSRDK